MSKLKVLCDLDSVLNNLTKVWSDYHNNDPESCGRPIDLSTHHQWDLSKHCGCGQHIYKYLWDETLYTSAEVIPGAIEGTRRIQEMGLDVYVLTASSNGYAVVGKYKWLAEHFPHIHRRKVIVCNDKAMIKGDIMIDDHIDNINSFEGYRILFDQPWNRDYFSKHSLNGISYEMRVKGWNEVIMRIEHIIAWNKRY